MRLRMPVAAMLTAAACACALPAPAAAQSELVAWLDPLVSNGAAQAVDERPDRSLVVVFHGFTTSHIGGALGSVAPDGSATLLAGHTQFGGFDGDSGPALQRRFCGLRDAVIRPSGEVDFTDVGNSRVRRLHTDGSLSTLLGSTPSSDPEMSTCAALSSFPPSGVDVDASGRLAISGWNHGIGIAILDVDGTLTTYPWPELRPVWAVAWESPTSIVATERDGYRIVRLDLVTRTYTKVAGYGVPGGEARGGSSPDGTLASASRVAYPHAVASLPNGNVIFSENGAIRIIDSDGRLRTIAAPYTGPEDLTLTPGGLLYPFGRAIYRIDKTKITAAPRPFIDVRHAEITFASFYDGPEFQCDVDDGGWQPCTSPLTLDDLADGPHEVRVRGTDADGTDPTPAVATFTVDTSAPNTIITTGPPSPTNSTEASVAFDSPQADATFECRSDDEENFSPCASPLDRYGLADGQHVVDVRAVLPDGDRDTTPATAVWTVDTVAPTTTVSQRPPDATSDKSASFTFSSPDGGTAFQCSLDGGAYETCTSPATRSGLTEGPHAMRIRALDAATNVQAPPTEVLWVVDPAPPETLLLGGPDPFTRATTAVFDIGSDEPGSTFRCSLDGPDLQACPNPRGYVGLAEGVHVFRAAARDSAGNDDPSPLEVSWTIDRTVPQPATAPFPAAGSTAIGPDTPLSFDPGTDALAGVDRHAVSIDGGLPILVDAAQCAARCSVQPPVSLADGSHTWRVTTIDRAGNQKESEDWTFATDAVAPSAPGALLPSGARIAGPRPVLSWSTASDLGSGIAGYDVTIDGAPTRRVTATTLAVEAPLSDGPHSWSVRAIDGAGNRSSVATASFSVDTTPPVVVVRAPTRVVVPFTANVDASESSDPDGGTISRFEYDTAGDGSFSPGSGPSIDVPITVAGERIVRVRATDAAGNAAIGQGRIVGEPAAAIQPGTFSVTINERAFATGSLDVTLRVIPPRRQGVRSILISNDGEPENADQRPIGADGAAIRVPWTLARGDRRAGDREVTVFFLTATGRQVDSVQDTIVYDPLPPVIQSIRIRSTAAGRRIRVRARDRHAGVRAVRIKAGGRTLVARSSPKARGGQRGRPLPHSVTLTLRTPVRRAVIEVVDHVGNTARRRIR